MALNKEEQLYYIKCEEHTYGVYMANFEGKPDLGILGRVKKEGDSMKKWEILRIAYRIKGKPNKIRIIVPNVYLYDPKDILQIKEKDLEFLLEKEELKSLKLTK